MLPEQIPVVVISGPVGVGKSTIGEEVGELLEQGREIGSGLDWHLKLAAELRTS